MNTEWISVEDRLPENKTYVLVHLLKDNWDDSEDAEGCLFVVAKFLRCDPKKQMGSNNLRPYLWRQFGPSTHCGQDVDFWMPIQKTPNQPENRERIIQSRKAKVKEFEALFRT